MGSQALLNLGDRRSYGQKLAVADVNRGIGLACNWEPCTKVVHRVKEDTEVVSQLRLIDKRPRRFKRIKVPDDNICNSPPAGLRR